MEPLSKGLPSFKGMTFELICAEFWFVFFRGGGGS